MQRPQIVASLAAAAAVFVAANSPARAAEPVLKTVTTTINLEQCEQSGDVEDGAIWTCPGLDGFKLTVAEGDLRQFISYGDRADEQKAATETLGAFNTIFKPDSQQTSIDWRVEELDGKATPFATILRYYTDNGLDGSEKATGEVLVVARLGPAGGDDACFVGYIDVLANADAMALAVAAADKSARAFDCNGDPVAIGAVGKSPINVGAGAEE